MMRMTEEWGVCLFDVVLVVVAHSAAYGLW